jgi:Ser/Thr protein kinase RdoA (MazF antagonist)
MTMLAQVDTGVMKKPLAVTRLQSLMTSEGLARVLSNSAVNLGLEEKDIASARAMRLHPRSDGGFVLEVVSVETERQLFVDVIAGRLSAATDKLMHRQIKQEERLGLRLPINFHADVESGSIVRLKGEDELIDGLVAISSPIHGKFGLQGLRSKPKLLAHRLNRRAVMKVEFADGAGGVIKAYKKGSTKAQAATEIHALLRNTAFSDSAPVRVPRILKQIESWPGYLMECVAGTSVAELAGQNRLAGMRLAGVALGRLHRLPLRLQVNHTAAHESQLLRDWVDLTCVLFPERSVTLKNVLVHVERLLNGTTQGTPTLVHRDFHESQVLVDGDAATLIDFDTACNGEPAQDIGNFLAHLDYAANLSKKSNEADEQAFVEAYQMTHTSVPEVRVRAHRVSTLLRLSCIHAFAESGRQVGEALAMKALSL